MTLMVSGSVERCATEGDEDVAKANTHKSHRSAVNGRFVSKSYADMHKKTTVEETVPNGKRKKK
jgi:hypothetical protein